MGSFRRSTSFAQRDGSGQNGKMSPTASSPSLSKTGLARGKVNLWGKMLDFLLMVLEKARAGFLLQRSSRSGERLRPKGMGHWRRAFFQFAGCFMIGAVVGFTPFMMVDMSKDLAAKHEKFLYEDNGAGNVQQKIGSVVDGSDALDTLYTQSPVLYSELVPRKLLIVVTPTYSRPFQAYYLNRLAHTLRIIPHPLLWIVVEMERQSAETARILRGAGLMYRHLVCDQNGTVVKEKAVHQRNVALSHIEKCRLDGIVFFADDDMVYSGDLFDNMREIRRFGTWPVAILTESKNKVWLQGPVCNGSQVAGWHTSWRSKSQRFHAHMSGFAFNSTILWDPLSWHRPTLEPIRQSDTVRADLQVTAFVERLVEDESQMEGFLSDCSRIMAWHLHVEAPELGYPNDWSLQKNLEVVAPLT